MLGRQGVGRWLADTLSASACVSSILSYRLLMHWLKRKRGEVDSVVCLELMNADYDSE